MATAKQIAARQLFAERAKAGAFKRRAAKGARKCNPAAKKSTAKRPASPKKTARSAPKRVALLKPKAHARKRNPMIEKKPETLYAVRVAGTRAVIGYGTTEAAGRRMAQALADKHGRAYEVARITR